MGHNSTQIIVQGNRKQCWQYQIRRRLYAALWCAQLLGCVQPCASPWTIAHQAPLSMELLQARIVQWVAIPSSAGSVLVSKDQDGESSGTIRSLVHKTEPKSCPGRQVGWRSSILQEEGQSVPSAEILWSWAYLSATFVVSFHLSQH